MGVRHGLAAALLSLGLLVGGSSPAAASHAIYSGRIGSHDITLVIHSRNAVQRAIYAYDRHRTPIRLKPAFLHVTRDFGMDELDAAGLPSARLRFDRAGFHRATPHLTGTWTDYRTGRTLPLQLALVATLDRDGAWPDSPHALLQAASTEQLYFRVPMDDEDAPVTRIGVMDKASGRRRQMLVLAQPACNLGIETVQVTIERGRTQLRLPVSAGCPGAVYQWNPATGAFEDLSAPPT